MSSQVPATGCPSDDELFAFSLGQLGAEMADRMSTHVAGCELCCAAVAATAAFREGGETLDHDEAEASGGRRDEALQPGEQLGRYQILEFLGRGAMGAVYSARDPQLDRLVAIKLLRSSTRLAARQGELQARLQREAQAMARLSHPNVVTVHELAEVDGRLFVAMELVRGGTLRSWLRERTRTLGEIVEVFLAAGQGLSAAHRAGIVHRDFKPENVLITAEGRALVTDFGLARSTRELVSAASFPRAEPGGGAHPADADASPGAIDDTSPTLPSPESGARSSPGLVGTPAYMAPEQLACEEVDARSDLFSYCVAFYEAVYRARPFPARTLDELRVSHAAGPLPPPPGNTVPAWLHQRLLKGLRAAPGERPASMAALLEDLERARTAPASAKTWTTRSWRGAISLLFILAAMAAAVAVVRARSSPRAACAEGARRIDQAWNPSRRQQIRDAFLNTRLAYASDALARVTVALDRFTKAWSDAYGEACMLGVEKADASTEAYLRMACLSEQLAAIQAKCELFAQADEKLVEDAAAMASAIEDPAQCTRGLALDAPPPPPALRSAVERVRADLAKLDSLREAGRFQEARQLSSRVVAEAQALLFRPVQAEALLAQAQIADESFDTAAALAGATSAALVAEGSRHDVVAARAWILALHDATELSFFDRAVDLERHARAALERVGGDDALTASLENAVGWMRGSEGNPEEALAAQRVAADSYRKTGREDRFYTWLLNDEASALEDLGRHAEAAAEFQRAVELKQRLLGPSHPDVGLSLSNLASVLTSMERFPEAAAALEKARAIFQLALPPGHFLYLWLDSNVGDLALAQGQVANALAAYQRALENAARNNLLKHPGARVALLGLGRAQLLSGSPVDAIATLEQALPPEGTPIDAVVLANIRFGLARALRAAKRDPERASQLVRQARAAFVANGARSSRSLAELDAWQAQR